MHGMFPYTQNTGLETLNSIGKGISENFTKITLTEVHEMSRCAHKTSFCLPLLLIGLDRVNLQTTLCWELHKISKDIQNNYVCNPHPHG